jgi:hypothetical protein
MSWFEFSPLGVTRLMMSPRGWRGDFLFVAAVKALPVLATVVTNKKYKQR